MKPLNLDNSPCSPISSNCVIWQGPSIPCIKLCTGDTVSDVVFKLATELCTIMDELNVSNYDLACLNLSGCDPKDFQALIQLLITKICNLENMTGPAPTPGSGGCPDNCIVSVISCLGGGTDTLTNYVNTIATRICSILDEIDTINSKIVGLDVRVTVLENTPAPVFTIPSFTLQCAIGTIIPVLAAGSTQQIDTVLSRFINEEWCPYKVILGTTTDLNSAVLAQCIAGTDTSLQFQYSAPGTQMQIAYPSYVASPTTVADALNNLWIALCDVRNAGDEITTVTAGNNVTVTSTTSVVGADQITDYTINANDTVVAAGDNVTITSATSPTNVTTYTINGKESIVAGTGDIVVTPVTVGNDTTYTVSRTAKINYYNEVISSIDITSDPGFIDLTYFSPTGYGTLSYTNTSGVSKDYIVNVSSDVQAYESTGGLNLALKNYIDIGLILNPGTVLYESQSRPDVNYQLWDSITNTPIDNATAEKILSSPSSNPITLGIADKARLPLNVSFFKKVTLTAGQTITVMFKSKTGESGKLLKAQIFVQEL